MFRDKTTKLKMKQGTQEREMLIEFTCIAKTCSDVSKVLFFKCKYKIGQQCTNTVASEIVGAQQRFSKRK